LSNTINGNEKTFFRYFVLMTALFSLYIS